MKLVDPKEMETIPLAKSRAKTKDIQDCQKVNNEQNMASLTSRRQRLKEGDEFMMSRVNKLKKNSQERGRNVIYLIWAPLYFVTFSIVSVFAVIKNSYASSIDSIKTSKRKIGEISLNVNMAYNLMYQGLSQAPEPLNHEGKLLNFNWE